MWSQETSDKDPEDCLLKVLLYVRLLCVFGDSVDK